MMKTSKQRKKIWIESANQYLPADGIVQKEILAAMRNVRDTESSRMNWLNTGSGVPNRDG